MKAQSRILVAQLGVLALFCLNSCTGSGVEFDLDQEPAVVTVVEQGWRLESSLNLEDGEYFCAAVAGPNTGELESAAILIEGQREVVLDLRGVVLRGADREADLDSLRGIGVLIRDCENIRVLGGTLGGYRVPVRVLRSRGVLIDGTNFDGWYAQPLQPMGGESEMAEDIDLHWGGTAESTRRFERYGAAIAVAASSRITIRNCRGRHGQNGVLFEAVQDSSVIDSDFSFLSGWGCALFDSIRNEVSNDVFDYCVRGVSEGGTSGQGAAGILLAGATRSNVVAECSATHCGTGLRLVASDSEGTVGNTIAHSEFSYATRHGILVEGPSEGDVFVSNQLGQAKQFGLRAENTTGLVCHDNVMSSARKGGVLLLDSEGSLISDNVIEDTECGIAVESSGASGKDGGAGHWLIHNSLGRNLADLRLRSLTELRLERNRFNSPAGRLQLERISDAELGAILGKEEALRRIMGRFTTPPAGLVSDVTFAPEEAERSSSILGDRSREAFLTGSGLDLDLKGRRSTRAADRGLELRDHDSIVLGKWGPWDFRAEEARPDRDRAGSGPLRTAKWRAIWFHWNNDQDPRGDLTRWRALRFQPVAEQAFHGGRWTSPYGMDPKPEHLARVGFEHYGLYARATIQVEKAGRYRLETISDDGVRVTLDGDVVLENWTWHPRTSDRAEFELAEGEHELELEYFQIDGASVLQLDLEPIERVRHRSGGE